MGIPGLEADLPISAKVRCGETENGRPVSRDYFLRDGESLGPSLLIQFPYAEPDRTWKSSLEWWGNETLVCYSKGELLKGKPVAFRLPNKVDPDDLVAGTTSSGRSKILCRAGNCPHSVSKQCKPKGRLVFSLVGDPTNVLQFETGSWASIKQIEGTIELAALAGTLKGRTFNLTVAFSRNRKGRFPVVNLREVKDGRSKTESQESEQEAPSPAEHGASWSDGEEGQQASEGSTSYSDFD